MTEDDFLVRFVRIFQDVAETVLQQVDNVPHLFDVAVAPDAMVRAIGGWVGLDWVDPELPDITQRRVVRGYSAGLLWRGTRAGLTRVLELVCEAPVRIEDSGAVFEDGHAPDSRPHVFIAVPTSGWATEADLVRIVRSELPASVTFELVVGGRTVHPLPDSTALTAGVS